MAREYWLSVFSDIPEFGTPQALAGLEIPVKEPR